MQVEYERTSLSRKADSVSEQESIQWWIKSNLKEGGIESQIEKLRNLLAIVGEQFLTDNPSYITSVASAIKCEGHGHKITHSEA